MLSEADCEGKSIEDLDVLEKVYRLPPVFLEEVEDYRDAIGQSKFMIFRTGNN